MATAFLTEKKLPTRIPGFQNYFHSKKSGSKFELVSLKHKPDVNSEIAILEAEILSPYGEEDSPKYKNNKKYLVKTIKADLPLSSELVKEEEKEDIPLPTKITAFRSMRARLAFR